MLILDFRTGKMTKLALDLGYVPAMAIPGALFGIGGAGLGSLIDMLPAPIVDGPRFLVC